MNEENLETYFQRQADYYKDEHRLISSGKILSFNIGTFFGGLLWFLYRKLYWQSAAFLLLIFLVSWLEGMLYSKLDISPESQSAFSFIVTLTLTLIVGFLGNYIYVKHATRKILAITAQYSDREQQLKQMRKDGGVSFTALFTGIGIIIILIGVAIYS